MNDTQVLIVGAGPTGLTLAIELARRGVGFRIVEKTPGHPAGSRGKGLRPRTQEVFDDLGVIDEILATGRIYPPIRTYMGEQVVWEGVMHEHREPEAAVPYPMVLMQPQWRIERIMRERLAGLGHHVELGIEAIAFEQDEDGVTVTLKRAAPDGAALEAAPENVVPETAAPDGAALVTAAPDGADVETAASDGADVETAASDGALVEGADGAASGGVERVRCAYLIGADGGRSSVRKLQRVRRIDGWVAGPEVVDQPFGGDHATGTEGEPDQEDPQPRAMDLGVAHVQRSQDPDSHNAPIVSFGLPLSGYPAENRIEAGSPPPGETFGLRCFSCS
ncbi:FAD binding domain-containing protein [Streptosporangium subroseum]|uniref:FAD binding domain-containing protein n=1 Tax=Streptosporangium subroseum TaxID=106412 RepID=A0A239EZH3_9ACTN|nr:FAD-dependent monooxygenase [Streptosporangium subroseum]SNS49302.1 FAD binding domain-containing protein [Streptosporangium subroseum]